MSTFQSFTEIEAWQKARELTFRVYAVSKRGAFAKDFELLGQIRSASVSVMSNIAEGFDRNGTAEFVQFLAIAKGSVAEVASQLYVAKDQSYFNAAEFDQLIALASETGRKIGALMNYLRRSGIKGTKFR
ncbi:MAG: four helix bundle protein [Candidatus Binatia bacterium]